MKRFLCVVQCLVLSLAAQAWATSDSQNCEAKSQQVKGEARSSLLKSCLAQASSPEHLRTIAAQEKRGTCEQNAKNMKLEGGRKSEYLNDCQNKNVAASEAKKLDARAPVLTKAEKSPRTKIASANHQTDAPKKSVAQNSSKKTCAKQAQQDGLKGNARKQFMGDCLKG